MDEKTNRLDENPTWRRCLRLAGVCLGFGIVAALAFYLGNWVVGVIAIVLAVAFALVCWGLGSLLMRIALRPIKMHKDGVAGGDAAKSAAPQKSSSLDQVCGAVAMAVLGGPGSAEGSEEVAAQARADLAARGLDPADAAESATDRAVGPMLCLLPPMEGEFGAQLSAERRAELRGLRLEERELTAAWYAERGPWGEVRIAGEDGAELVGHAIAPALRDGQPAGRWAVLAHGYRGSWREMIQYARRWSEMGYGLLLVEQRAHGRSGGEVIGMGYLERRDLVAWCHWLEGERGASSIVLHGHSMGGAAVCLASGEPDVPASVSAVVADCAFSSAWAAFTGLLDASDTPVHPTVDLLRLRLALARGGYDLAKADPCAALARPGVPVLLFQGACDTMVPAYMALDLQAAAARGGRRSAFFEVPDAGHCQSVLADGDAYFERVRAFLEG